MIRCYIAIFAVLLLRIISLGSYDLNDTTEARYSGIAMRMVNHDDYITSYVEPSLPFLAKPPLSFWLTAASFKIFGINEFAARLPHFLLGILLAGILYLIFKKLYGLKNSLILPTIILTTPAFIVMSGFVMTESVLIFFISIAMLSAWLRLEKNGNKFCSYMFFISLGFSMLAKGPIGVVMTCIPLAIYLTIYRSWALFFKKFNIFSGALISILIFLPWYIIEEIKNPGFLEYFIIGEHFGRFLMPGWKGDLYGHAHNEPIGMIIVYFILSTIPWIFYPIFSFFKSPTSWIKRKPDKDVIFFSCFTLFPIVFFLLARNIIVSYGLYSVVPFSILMFYFFQKHEPKIVPFTYTVAFCSAVLFSTLALNHFYFIIDNTDKLLIRYALLHSKEEVFYFKRDLKYASRFYSNDKVKKLEHEKDFSKLPDDVFIIINNNIFDNIQSESLKNNLKVIMCNHKNDRCLYKYHYKH